MGILVYFLYPGLVQGIVNAISHPVRQLYVDIIALSITILFGAIIYAGMTWLLRAEEFFTMLHWIQRRKIEL